MNLLVRSFHAGAPSEIHAVRGLLDTVRRLIVALQPAQIVFATEGGHAYRRAMHDGYKASRSETPPELRDQIVIAHAAIDALGWPLLRVPDYEADDVLATLARQFGDRVTIVSNDKDLWQLADRSRIYAPYERQLITGETCRAKWGVLPHQLGDLLALMGDKVDDVPGVPSVGQKTAAAWLNKYGDLDAVLVESVRRFSGCGKAWQSLYEHRSAAQLSRRLVTLVDDLPLPTTWQTATLIPRLTHWVDRFRAHGLGAVAKRLGDAFDSFNRKPEACANSTRIIEEGPSATGLRQTKRDDGQRTDAVATDDTTRTNIAGNHRDRSQEAGSGASGSAAGGRYYQRGRDWAQQNTLIAQQIASGERDPRSCHAAPRDAEQLAAWLAGVRGEPHKSMTAPAADTSPPDKPAPKPRSLF